MMQNRRKHYRIWYPYEERPRFVYGTVISEVLECSERGLRLHAPVMPKLGERISGRIRMRHGEELKVSGRVVRCQAPTVALHLDRGPIPFQAMMREQLYLREIARDSG